jgi:hypothetical protein
MPVSPSACATPLSQPMAVGAPAMLRLAERWSAATVRAAALLRRVDVVSGVLDITGAPGLSGLRDGDDDARVRRAETALPAASLLVLDDRDAVHLVGLRDGPFQLRPSPCASGPTATCACASARAATGSSGRWRSPT